MCVCARACLRNGLIRDQLETAATIVDENRGPGISKMSKA